mmetsp:Transcript_18487/g.37367  ORF Transcript_18487/g.37367 Transcript_18487/m.37367 type:complete len:316 (-) Transcript_18487:436-1383(-)
MPLGLLRRSGVLFVPLPVILLFLVPPMWHMPHTAIVPGTIAIAPPAPPLHQLPSAAQARPRPVRPAAGDVRSTLSSGNSTLAQPLAIVLFAPHKTGSTFFTSFLHNFASELGLCWYTDNAAFMYTPRDHSKCASPSCGHRGHQRSYRESDRGWGDCTSFTDKQLRKAQACQVARTTGGGGCAVSPNAWRGMVWGVLRLPPAMHAAIALLGTAPWHWYLVLHSRHPGDTLVSGYHSFGWTHPPAPGATAEQRRQHEERQAAIRNQRLAPLSPPTLLAAFPSWTPFRLTLDSVPPHPTRPTVVRLLIWGCPPAWMTT